MKKIFRIYKRPEIIVDGRVAFEAEKALVVNLGFFYAYFFTRFRKSYIDIRLGKYRMHVTPVRIFSVGRKHAHFFTVTTVGKPLPSCVSDREASERVALAVSALRLAAPSSAVGLDSGAVTYGGYPERYLLAPERRSFLQVLNWRRDAYLAAKT